MRSGQNTLAPEGTVADRQRDLFLIVVWPAAAIFILVEGLILFIVFKFRRRKGDDSLPRQVHGNPALEIAWTIAPAILLAIIAVPTLAGVVELGRSAEGRRHERQGDRRAVGLAVRIPGPQGHRRQRHRR